MFYAISVQNISLIFIMANPVRQLSSHFRFKTLLWVLAQAPPLRATASRFPILQRALVRLNTSHASVMKPQAILKGFLFCRASVHLTLNRISP